MHRLTLMEVFDHPPRSPASRPRHSLSPSVVYLMIWLIGNSRGFTVRLYYISIHSAYTNGRNRWTKCGRFYKLVDYSLPKLYSESHKNRSILHGCVTSLYVISMTTHALGPTRHVTTYA